MTEAEKKRRLEIMMLNNQILSDRRSSLSAVDGGVPTSTTPIPPPTPTFELGKFEIAYNSSDYAYITSSATFSDTGALVSGSNVISAYTIGANDSSGANTGLSYYFASSGLPGDDLICVKTYNNNRLRFFPKSLFVPGMSTTIPTPTINLLMQGSQGTSVDNVNNRIFECLENTQEIRITDLSGNEIERFSVPVGALQPSTLFYDIFEDVLYVTISALMRKYKKIAGTWTDTGAFWFSTAEGNCIDYITSKVFVNRALSNSTINKMAEQDVNGWFNSIYPFPTTTTGSVHEAIMVDPRDETIWFNSDQNFHGGVNNGNRLWRADLKKVFRKKIFFPDMVRYSKFKIDGTITGQFNRQKIVSSGWSISPVIDFIAFTGQQSILNYASSNSSYDIEFRGSAIAPTTISESSGHLDIYDANQSNDGWGSTVPSSFGASPTTDRYMQFRIKPKTYTAVDAYAALAALNLDVLFIMNTKDGIYYDPTDSNRVELFVNKYNTANNFQYNISAGTASKPTFIEGSSWVTKTGTQYMTLSTPSQFLSDTQGEFGYVMRSAAGTSTNQVIAFAGSNPSSDNGWFKIGHYRSNESAFANAHHITHNIGGTVSRIGFIDADHSTFSLISFLSDGATNRGFKNNVEQTLTANAGSNTGKWFSSAAGATVIDWGVWRTQTGGVNPGLADCKFLYGRRTPLSASERTSLYNAVVALGII